MAGRAEAQVRPGWTLEPDLNPLDEQLRRRRWRVLRAALPPSRGLDPMPPWVKTPDQFIDWIAGRLSSAAIRGYFADLELIAKQTCDLELLRLARSYQRRR
ncbi:MAG TPA: hypothetical protein VFA22_07335 [Stellaceae bacterium]|nr:hypothetical protein [Stellaceae bacterium]